jgi:UPF0755 protein
MICQGGLALKNRKKDYTHQSLRDERQYGLYWYSGLWHILRPILVVAGALIVVVGLLMTGWNWVYGNYLSPVDAADTAPVTFVVENGNSLSKVAANLKSQNLVRNPTIFKYYSDFIGLGQKIQSGEYILTRAMTIDEIANQLTTGDGKPMTATITVIPGWTIEDIAQKLFTDGVITSKDEFLAKARSGKDFSDYYYVADVLASPNVGQRKFVLEGYLSPNTYEVYTDATTDDIIRKLLSQTEVAFPASYYERAEQIGFTMDQVITLASLIEKEAKEPDFSKVSAVFHNRLKDNIKLGSDATINYITGVRRMALRNEDMNVNSPYNTYKNSGLPLGPICNPSPAAIMAALYPDETFVADKYMYFCSKDPNTGELVFSKTLEEHNQAVAIYAPLWEAYDESRGL